jgi:hypothetical protein
MHGLHWEKLHAVVDEAQERAANALSDMEAINDDANLSAQGKARQKMKCAQDAITAFASSKTLSQAKDAVERQLKNWANLTGVAIKPPNNFQEAMLHAEIRAHLAATKDNRLAFLEKHATDPRVASAVLGAPQFLSGLSDTEAAVLRKKVEQHTAPEIAKERDATLKAIKEAEAGWETAIRKIAARGGLTKGPDGAWRDPSISRQPNLG